MVEDTSFIDNIRTAEELRVENAKLRAENAILSRKVTKLTWCFSALHAKFEYLLSELIDEITEHYSTEYGWFCHDHYYKKGERYSPDYLSCKISCTNAVHDVSDIREGIDLYAHFIDIDEQYGAE